MTATQVAEKKKKSSPITSILLGLAIGGLCGWTGMIVGNVMRGKHPAGMEGVPLWLPPVFVIVACFGGLILHELGHLLAGLSVGFTPYLFAVGPLRIERDDTGKYRTKWNRDIGLWGGAVASLPSADLHNKGELLHKFARIIAAGPLVSFTFAALGMGIGLTLPGHLTTLRLFLLMTGGINAVYCLITALPIANGDYLTDGARFLQLIRGGAKAQRDVALLHLYSLMNTGTRPGKWSSELIADVLTPDDGSVFASTGNFFAYLYAVDRGEITDAAIYLQKAMDNAPNVQKPAYAVEAAYFAAWHQQNVVEAEFFLTEAGERPLGVSEADLLRARAATALRQGKVAEGKAHLDKAVAVISNTPATIWTGARLLEMRAAFFSPIYSQI